MYSIIEDENLLTYWEFTEGQGNIALDSTGTFHGILSGATWINGQVGEALSFDGVDDYVSIDGSGITLVRTVLIRIPKCLGVTVTQ